MFGMLLLHFKRLKTCSYAGVLMYDVHVAVMHDVGQLIRHLPDLQRADIVV